MNRKELIEEQRAVNSEMNFQGTFDSHIQYFEDTNVVNIEAFVNPENVVSPVTLIGFDNDAQSIMLSAGNPGADDDSFENVFINLEDVDAVIDKLQQLQRVNTTTH